MQSLAQIQLCWTWQRCYTVLSDSMCWKIHNPLSEVNTLPEVTAPTATDIQMITPHGTNANQDDPANDVHPGRGKHITVGRIAIG